MMRVLTPPIGKTPTLSEATFACPDVSTFCWLDELGSTSSASGSSRIERSCRAAWSSQTPGAAAAAARAARAAWWSSGSRTSRWGGAPTTLLGTVRRYR